VFQYYGGIYLTIDEAAYWKSLVSETVDVTLNRSVSSNIGGVSYLDIESNFSKSWNNLFY